MRLLARCSTVAVALLLVCGVALGQAVTGTLTGNVTTEGVPLPGVTVTIASPSMQGTRVAVTDLNGAYNFPALPPGEYSVGFELEGMDVVTRVVVVSLGQTARADGVMGVAAVTEAITVEASAPTALETTAVSMNFEKETIDALPIDRTIDGVTELAPGISTEGPNNQIMISGAPSYESLYLLNGAVVNESLRGQPTSLYIEDAISETTVMTGSVSAEYGRFTGGVVNTITKSGGNEFSGSFRTNMENDDWTKLTPYPGEAPHEDDISYTYEATLGGRIVRDRLWFFGAGRTEEASIARQTRDTDIPYTFTEEEDRYEIKLTGQINPRHSLVGSYLDREILQDGRGFTESTITDLRSLTYRTLPYSLAAVNYSGILTSNLLIELGWSERKFAFVGSGAKTSDLIQGTMVRDYSTGRRAWSPQFCGVCSPPKARDNEYSQLKGSYFLSTAGLGNHNFVAGLEDFSMLREENNDQTGSAFTFYGRFRYVGGNVFLHTPNDSSSARILFNPILNASLTSDGNTRSAYVNDSWDLNQYWSFNIGVRYDQNESVDQAGNLTADDRAFSPRLAATYDVGGDGRHRIMVGYGEYAAAIDNGVNDEASNAGSPASFTWYYRGPVLNGPDVADADLLPTDVVLQAAFDWFYDVNCPGYDRQSHETIQCTENLRSASLPGVSTQFVEGGLDSPTMREYSLGYGVTLGSGGYLRVDLIDREWSDFYMRWKNLDNGKVTNDLGQVFDLTLVGNNDTGFSREYQSVQVQSNYRFTDRLSLGGNYTWAELRGNAQTEFSGSATDSIHAINSYPEYRELSWNAPVRALPGDVEHRLNVWASYDLPTPIGSFNFSLLGRLHSGYPYYAAGTIDVSMIDNPGYETPDTTWTYYFENAKEYRTDDVTRTDIAVNYALPIGPLELFLQADVLNVFDESGVEDPDGLRTTIYTSNNRSSLEPFNPFTETPIEGVHWEKHSNFGQPNSDSAYQLPLTYRFSVGLRF